MPANPLTPDQLAEAAKVKQLFTAWQKRRRDQGEPASQEAVSEMLGFNQSALSQYLNGKIPLNVEAATKFATLIGVPIAEFSPSLSLLAARYASVAGEESSAAPYLANASRVTLEEPDSIPVKQVTLRLQAGFPGFEADQNFEDGGVLNVPRQFIEENDLVPHCLLAVKVRGDSMESLFFDGDSAVINIANTKWVDQGVYAFNFDGLPVIKRLVRERNDWWLKSENPLYPIERARNGNAIIIGRVVWRPASSRF